MSTSVPIRVLVVDDHRLIRDALTNLFTATEDIEAVGQCADGSEVAAAVRLTRPDVIVMDLQMPHVDGLTAARAVLEDRPEVRVLILTGGLTAASAREASVLGVAGYLLKDDDPTALPDHVRVVAAGGSSWHPLATALLAEEQGPAAVLGAVAVGTPHFDECPVRLHHLQ